MRKRLPRLRVPRSIRLLAAIFILVIVLTTGAVYLPRLAPDSYHCLRYDVETRRSGFLEPVTPYSVDIRSGSFAIDLRNKPRTANQDTLATSPDGQYKAIQYIDIKGKPVLYLGKVDGEGGVVETDSSRLVSDYRGDMMPQISWHPKSLWFAFMAQNPSGPQLAIMQPNGARRWSVPLAKTDTGLLLYPNAVSNDAAYYVFSSADGQRRDYHFLNLSNLTEQKVIPVDTTTTNIEWSPQGHWLAVADTQKDHLQILSPEDGVIQSFKIAPDARFIQMRWSPDGKYVALLLIGNAPDGLGGGTLTVYGRDGKEFSSMTVASDDMTAYGSFYWSNDSRSIVFLEPLPANLHYTLKQFSLDKREVKSILNDVTFASMDHQIDAKFSSAFGLRREYEYKQNLYWLPIGTVTPVQIVSDATTINSLCCSFNKHGLTIAWTVGEGIATQNKTTMFDPKDGTVIKTLDTEGDPLFGFWETETDWLAYEVQLKGKSSLYLLNSVTGQNRRFAEEMVDARLVQIIGDRNARLVVEWEDKTGQRGIDTYTATGTLVAHFPYTGTGIPYRAVSPDGQSIVLISKSRLEIATINASDRKVIPYGSSGLVWSPDSKYIAIASWGVLEIFTSTGESVWQNTLRGSEFANPQWTKCY